MKRCLRSLDFIGTKYLGPMCLWRSLVCWVVAVYVLSSGVGNLTPQPVLGQAGEQPTMYMYTVQRGDTLSTLAQRFSTDIQTLMALNQIRDPRHVYPGQQILLSTLPSLNRQSWRPYSIPLGENFAHLARRAGMNWVTLAQANRLLNPTSLLPGQKIDLPVPASAEVVSGPLSSRWGLAMQRGAAFWQVMRLNPLSTYMGNTALAPAQTASLKLPSPLLALTIQPQPVVRGGSAVLKMQLQTPASCEVTYLDRVEACYAQMTTSPVAMLAFPPLLEPGRYQIALRIWIEAEEQMLSLPIMVTAGRYDYERIDLPSDRQTLLDPTLSQLEREKIAALRTLRSAERWWEFPFTLPLEASVTSYYGSRRSYGGGFTSFHAGTDFRAEKGTPVLAPASGKVVLAEPLLVRGHAILIDHGWGVVTGYWHLSRIDVEPEQFVSPGDPLGAVGNTGLSTGPHLHWEMWVNGVSVSALQWLNPFAPLSVSAPSLRP